MNFPRKLSPLLLEGFLLSSLYLPAAAQLAKVNHDAHYNAASGSAKNNAQLTLIF